jgi:AcrR family transcriptional regulator
MSQPAHWTHRCAFIFAQSGTACHKLHAVQKPDSTLVEFPEKQDDSGSLRERKHQWVRQQIEDAAWELFLSVGFDQATIEAISQKAGVSRRTFFRYFEGKEELLSASVRDFGDRIAQGFAEMPRSMDPFTALAEAMHAAICEELKDEHQPREMLGLIFEDPSLRGRFLWAMSQWTTALGEELARRKACNGDRARCELAAALYCTAFDQAHMQWFRYGGRSLQAQVKRVFRQLRDLH